MPILTEGAHAGEFIAREANGDRSRAKVTIAASQTLLAGHVIAQAVDTDEGNWTVAKPSGTGTATIASTPNGAGIKAGVYTVRMTGAGSLATFVVIDPDNIVVGTGIVGTQFVGPIIFTLADGATDYAIDDVVTITVPAAEWAEYDPTDTTGLDTPRGILIEPTTTGSGETVEKAAIVRDATITSDLLNWFSGATSGQKTTGLAALAKLGIIAR